MCMLLSPTDNTHALILTVFYHWCHSTVKSWGRTKYVSMQICQLVSCCQTKGLEESLVGPLHSPGISSLTRVPSCPCRHGGHGRVQLHWEQCVRHPHWPWSSLGPADLGCGLWILCKWFRSIFSWRFIKFRATRTLCLVALAPVTLSQGKEVWKY